MKKHIRLVLWATILGGIASLWILVHAQAQSNEQGGGRIDAFTFYIPYLTDILDDQFNTGQSTTDLTNVDIETIISIAVQREGTIIYYDEWEDGLEPDLTRPIQPTTKIWGDGSPNNNGPTETVHGLPNDDLLREGTVITLRNIVDLPRDQADFFFDGSDLLTAIGGPIAVSLTFWTAPPGPGILFADAWELYPTNRWGRNYRIPIGENLAGNGPNQRLGFEVVGLNVQAVSNNTEVRIDADANGDFETTVTLNQGEQFNRLGTRSGIGPDSVLVGARVEASEPVQVHLFTAYPNSTYEARGYTLVPLDQWSNDYLAPRSSDGDFWLYNPDDEELEIQVETTLTNPTTITIPSNSTVKYPESGLMEATGTCFSSTDGRAFSGLAAFDEADAQDWGHVLLPFNRLATQTLIGLGLGNNNQPPDNDQNRIYVTAVEETTLTVIYSNGARRDFEVSPLEEVDIVDPDNHDMTGAFLFTSNEVPFATVWGQDQDADPALPSIDAGTGIVPLPALLLQKTFAISEDVDCTGSVTVGDSIQFRLHYFNETANSVRNIFLSDTLPGTVVYVPNTTLLNGAPIPDSGTTPFPFDEGGYHVGDLGAFGAGSATFEVRISDGASPIVNQAEVRSEDLPQSSDSVIVFTPTQTNAPLYQIDLRVIDPADGLVSGGQVVTFSLVVTNTGSETITSFPLRTTFEIQYLTFQNAAPPPDGVDAGQISWNDLTSSFGDLAPSAAMNLTVNWAVLENLPPTAIATSLRTIGSGGTLSDGTILPACSDVAVLSIEPAQIPTPSPTSTPLPTSTAISEPPDTPTPPPPSTPAGTPIAVNIPAPTSTVFPVNLLPETGRRETPGAWGMDWSGLFFGVAIAVICWFWRNSQLRN
ncbi:MAG: IgGFc-binding protein [Anaerolineae bacterium]|nr:IgGFc-binding protein [Anaerolineae bacterium]